MRKLGTNSPGPRKSKSGSSRSTGYTKPSSISGPDPKGNEVQHRIDHRRMTPEQRRRRYAALFEAIRNL
jgi:hypothetical protein